MDDSTQNEPPVRDRVFGCRDVAQAKRVLNSLHTDWELTAVLKIGHNMDAIVGKSRLGLGTAMHFINAATELVASYSQTNGALHVYAQPHKLGKIFLREYNIMERTQRWDQ